MLSTCFITSGYFSCFILPFAFVCEIHQTYRQKRGLAFLFKLRFSSFSLQLGPWMRKGEWLSDQVRAGAQARVVASGFPGLPRATAISGIPRGCGTTLSKAVSARIVG